VNSTRPTAVKGNAAINAAARQGGVQAEKKYYGTCSLSISLLIRIAGQNAKAARSTEGQHLTKIDRENEVAPPPKLDITVGKTIAKARAEKDPPMKQSELAQKINEKPSVINGSISHMSDVADFALDYENGKAIPNQQILAKMERVLGVKLRGKDIGSKLEDKHASKK